MRLFVRGGDGMEGVLSVDDEMKPSYPIGGATRDDDILERSFLVFSS